MQVHLTYVSSKCIQQQLSSWKNVLFISVLINPLKKVDAFFFLKNTYIKDKLALAHKKTNRVLL